MGGFPKLAAPPNVAGAAGLAGGRGDSAGQTTEDPGGRPVLGVPAGICADPLVADLHVGVSLAMTGTVFLLCTAPRRKETCLDLPGPDQPDDLAVAAMCYGRGQRRASCRSA
jgi:hypothetical protein